MRRGLTSHFILTTVAFGIVAAVSAQGPRTDPGAYVPGPNMPMPNYFSGTYNVVQGYVKPYPKPINLPIFPESQITYIGLKVNGVLVEQRNEDPNLIHMSVQIGDIIDSTAFAHGSTLTVEVVATDNYQRNYSDTDSSVVRNKLPVFVHHHFLGPVETTLGGHSNYHQIFELRNGWTRNLYLARLQDATSVMVATHGNPEPRIVDDLFTASPSLPSSRITSPDVLNTRINQIGFGLPPFNAGSAPMNICFLLACSAAADPSLILAHLFPWEDAYGNVMLNQGGHGYSDSMWIYTAPNHSVVFWYGMSQGRTIRVSVNNMMSLEAALIAYYEANGIPYPGPLFPIGENNTVTPSIPDRPFLISSDGPVWGDIYAKSRGVYTANNSETLSWYRN
jgi:hypothetical protein